MKIEIGKSYKIKSAKPNKIKVTGKVVEKRQDVILVETEKGERIALLRACIMKAEKNIDCGKYRIEENAG